MCVPLKSLLLCFLLSPLSMQAATEPPTAEATTATQTISPKAVYVHLSQTQAFVSAGAAKWTTSLGIGVSPTGVFFAPSAMPKSTLATVTATGPGGSASATITLVSGPLQVVSPASAHLALGAKQQFASAGSRTWSALYGSITAAGLYTAPTVWPASGTDTVTVNGLQGSAIANIALVPPVPVITSAGNSGQIPLGAFSVAVRGTGLISASTVRFNNILLHTTYSAGVLTVSGFGAVPGSGSLVVTNLTTPSKPFPVYIGVQNARASAAAARRLLQQAAFGPSPDSANRVQQVGLNAWIQEQFNSIWISNYNGVHTQYQGMPQQFLVNAVTCPDQLRQRVAFALSQIFVTSLDKLSSNPNMISYQNMLLAKAFTNYRQIMQFVTMSPAMGEYLDLANNAKANPSTGSEANQNYAREVMQLFTLGTNLLNQDGTPKLDSNGLPIPTYTQAQVAEFSRVYTGWTYAPKPGAPVIWNAPISGYGLMVPYAAEHDSGSKQLLNGHVSPAGLSPASDLTEALDNIFSHPNVGPFVGRQLIQHLVKSNPSPAYVSRVAAAFNNNGHGVRGDMKAVITAILLDPEARADDESEDDQATDGHLQEPVLFVAGMIRAFGGTMTTGNYYSWDLSNMGQDIFSSPSVFNYYAPDYGAPGTSLMGGEFQIQTPNNAILRANLVSTLFSRYSAPVQNYGPGTSVDLSAFLPYAQVSPPQLVNALDLTLTRGKMPSEMKQAIVAAVAAETGGALRRTQRAIYLILTSNYYNVWH